MVRQAHTTPTVDMQTLCDNPRAHARKDECDTQIKFHPSCDRQKACVDLFAPTLLLVFFETTS